MGKKHETNREINGSLPNKPAMKENMFGKNQGPERRMVNYASTHAFVDASILMRRRMRSSIYHSLSVLKHNYYFFHIEIVWYTLLRPIYFYDADWIAYSIGTLKLKIIIQYW